MIIFLIRLCFFLENLSKNDIGLSIENQSKNNKKVIKNFASLSLKTKDFKFNREEAHER